MIGLPNEGASDSRMLRGITLRHTVLAEVRANLRRHLLTQSGPCVVHHEHDRGDLQLGVQVPLHQIDVPCQLTKPSRA